MTPLHWAAREGHVGTVTFFLEQGIDINIKDEDGVSEQDYTADCKLVVKIWVWVLHPTKCLVSTVQYARKLKTLNV